MAHFIQKQNFIKLTQKLGMIQKSLQKTIQMAMEILYSSWNYDG